MTSNAETKQITLDNIDANPFATILLVSTTTETKKFLKTDIRINQKLVRIPSRISSNTKNRVKNRRINLKEFIVQNNLIFLIDITLAITKTKPSRKKRFSNRRNQDLRVVVNAPLMTSSFVFQLK